MNSTNNGGAYLQSMAAGLTTLIEALLEAVLGPGVHAPVYAGVTRADLGVVVCLLLLVLAVSTGVGWIVGVRLRKADAEGASAAWRAHLWRTVGRPLQFFVWIYGLYFAVTPALRRLSAANEPHPASVLLDRLSDIGVFLVFLWLVFKFTHVIEARLKRWTSGTSSRMDDLLVPALGRSLRVIVPVVGLIFALPLIGLSPDSASLLGKGSSILIIGTVAYILLQAVALIEAAVLCQYDVKAADNLQARKVYTQVHVLSKALYLIIAIFTVASVLMLFEEVRRFGTSILASAGVVGIIIGFAAQRTIANLFAGFQLAMTQPIRLDDVVIVEGEWGRVEEILLTYVVIHIWDDRRLIVPLSHFIEKPFQNWTRKSADILGSVFVWVDYTLPISELRPAIERIVADCPEWDRRFWNLQVTDTTERAMQIRVLATASDASKAWTLRCEIREKLVGLLQERYPGGLPKVRAALESRPVSD